jgi:plastocyanin
MENQTQSGMGTSKAYLFILLLAIVFLGGGVLYLTVYKNQKPPVKKAVVPTVIPLPKEVTVRLTKDGFVPKTVTIEAGGAVRWVNESGQSDSTVNSNPHPLNNEHKELNLGAFNGSTLVHIFTKPDTYGYHDYFHPEWTGTVIVK